MRVSFIFAITAAFTTAAGIAQAQDALFADAAPLLSRSVSQSVEFTPMTRSERFRHYLTGTFGPGSLAKAVAHAGLDEWRDSPAEWNQGSRGFAERLGNAYAKHIIRHTLEYGASTALHQDNRYFASGETGTWRRAKYAIASTFLARRDNGRRTLALARIGSAAGTAVISRAWQPASASGMGDAATSFGFTMATDLGTNLFREFWPDLKHRFQRR